MNNTIRDELEKALAPFAEYADPRKKVPRDLLITHGSSIAKRQLTMADCYAAADALARHRTAKEAEPDLAVLEKYRELNGALIDAWGTGSHAPLAARMADLVKFYFEDMTARDRAMIDATGAKP